MSVLSWNRTTSKMEYINVALEIYKETLAFTSRLSARYARTLGNRINDLAAQLAEEVEKGNSIYPNSDDAKRQRKWHLREARGALMALGVQLTMAYRILSESPEDAMCKRRKHNADGTRSGPQPMERGEALEKLDKMAERLGLMLDRENELLKGAISAVK